MSSKLLAQAEHAVGADRCASDQQTGGLQASIDCGPRQASRRIFILPQAMIDTLYDSSASAVTTIFTQLNQYRVVLRRPTLSTHARALDKVLSSHRRADGAAQCLRAFDIKSRHCHQHEGQFRASPSRSIFARKFPPGGGERDSAAQREIGPADS